jgi:hypothetical protein
VKRKIALVVVIVLIGVFVVWPRVRAARVDALIRELPTADAAGRDAIAERLSGEGSAPVLPLIAMLPGQGKGVTLAILRALDGNFAQCIYTSGIMNCENGYVPGQPQARDALTAAVPVVIGLLSDPDADIRAAALQALHCSAFHVAYPYEERLRMVTLLETLVHDPDRDVRLAAVQLAIYLKIGEATSVVLAAADDVDDEIRGKVVDYAVEHFSTSGDPGMEYPVDEQLTAEILSRALESTKGRIGFQGIRFLNGHEMACNFVALCRVGGTAEVAALLNHSEPEVQFQAAQALLMNGRERVAVTKLLELARGSGYKRQHSDELLERLTTWRNETMEGALERIRSEDPALWQEVKDRHKEARPGLDESR